jgi:hypothetical protein
MKTPHFIIALTIVCMFALSACQTSLRTRTRDHSDQKAITMTVLADMITNADTSNMFIRFVDVQEPIIQELRKQCGSGYLIESVSMAVRKSNRYYENGSVPDQGYYLMNGLKEGVLLQVKLISVGRWRLRREDHISGAFPGADSATS